MERIPHDISLAHTVNAVNMDHIIGTHVLLCLFVASKGAKENVCAKTN
jgi:hypothetical protein